MKIFGSVHQNPVLTPPDFISTSFSVNYAESYFVNFEYFHFFFDFLANGTYFHILDFSLMTKFEKNEKFQN